MYAVEKNEMVQCPYNRSHILKKLRIQKHLVKCQKQHPDIKLAACLYNYTHRFKPEKMLEHYETCPNKTRIEGARYDESPDLFENQFLEFCGINERNPVSTSEKKTELNLNYKFGKNHRHHKISAASEPFQCYRKDINFFNDNDNSLSSSEDELEPLPLPKTTSKAFCGFEASKKKISKSSSNSSKGKFDEHSVESETSWENCNSNSSPDDSLFYKSTKSSCGTNTLSFDNGTNTLSFDNVSISENEQIILKEFQSYVTLKD